MEFFFYLPPPFWHFLPPRGGNFRKGGGKFFRGGGIKGGGIFFRGGGKKGKYSLVVGGDEESREAGRGCSGKCVIFSGWVREVKGGWVCGLFSSACTGLRKKSSIRLS